MPSLLHPHDQFIRGMFLIATLGPA